MYLRTQVNRLTAGKNTRQLANSGEESFTDAPSSPAIPPGDEFAGLWTTAAQPRSD